MAEGMASVEGYRSRAGYREVGYRWTPSNKRMHATADTLDVIFGNRLGRRVMRSVRLLGRYKHSAD
jgi:hypothetical protein